MSFTIKPLLLTIIIFCTAAAGFFLKYFDLPAYFIFLGFRFHLGCLLPFLFIIRGNSFSSFKQYFISPDYKKQTAPVLWIFIPLLAAAALYLTGIVELTDPEYFYEFGVSSIIDYPIYLLWNFLQLSMLFIFLKTVQLTYRKNLFLIAFLIILLFSYEAIPVELTGFDYYAITALALTALSGAFILTYFPNVYWFSISIFTFLWISLLLFGTKSATAVNIIFAANYSNWEGFLTGDKMYNDFLIPGYTFLVLLLIVISTLTRKSNVQSPKTN